MQGIQIKINLFAYFSKRAKGYATGGTHTLINTHTHTNTVTGTWTFMWLKLNKNQTRSRQSGPEQSHVQAWPGCAQGCACSGGLTKRMNIAKSSHAILFALFSLQSKWNPLRSGRPRRTVRSPTQCGISPTMEKKLNI